MSGTFRGLDGHASLERKRFPFQDTFENDQEMIHLVFLNTFRLPAIHTERRISFKNPPPLKPAVQMPTAEETPASAADPAVRSVKLPAALVAFHQGE
ncbi:MAG: hypothetical protein MPW16_06235 [Candidatus Manganitrophus sp.]|nr:MAG: hypothetical protein MPW16_06235 [Candidatus Manganitrophus sp.]